MDQKQVFKIVYQVSEELKMPAYVVGGLVRDEIMGRKKEIKDIDFVIVGSGLQFAKKFDETMEQSGSLVEFPDFDTARYVFPDLEVEFAGARSEAYKIDSRKPQVAAASLATDLKRRDFTVNAMARAVLKSGLSKILIDPFGGLKDIENKILRTPLDPNTTFSEDPLRMMRAARFAAQLDFKIESEAYQAIVNNKNRLKIISAERIQEELLKLLAAPLPSVGLYILHESGLFDEFMPEVSALKGVEDAFGHKHKDNLWHTFQVVDNIAKYSDKTILRLAGLLHDIAKPGTKKYVPGRGWTFDMHEHLGKKMARAICRRLRVSNDITEYVAKLVRWHLYPIAIMDEGVTDAPVRRLVVNLTDDLTDMLILCRADITTGNPNKKEKRLRNYDTLEKRIEEVLEKDKLRAFQSPLRGEEIIELTGLKPGPTVGKIKKVLEEAILDGVIPNEYEAVKEYFLEIKDRFLAGAGEWEKKSNKKNVLPTYRQFLDELINSLQNRNDVVFEKVGVLKYLTKSGEKYYDYCKISSANITESDKILLIRAGIHGDETPGPFAIMERVSEIFDYAHGRGVKLIVFPLDNPSGFEAGTRYNIEGDSGDAGNNDFLRYILADGSITDDLGVGSDFKEWKWSSDPALGVKLPAETAALHLELKKLPLNQIVGVLDLHADNFINAPYFYQYGFGDTGVYRDIVRKIHAVIPVLANEYIDSGYLNKPDYRPEQIKDGEIVEDPFAPKSDADGFIRRHDGTLPDLFYRLGAKYCITVEVTGDVDRNLAEEANLGWIKGLIDLVARG